MSDTKQNNSPINKRECPATAVKMIYAIVKAAADGARLAARVPVIAERSFFE